MSELRVLKPALELIALSDFVFLDAPGGLPAGDATKSYEILAIGPGRWDHGVFISSESEVGEAVIPLGGRYLEIQGRGVILCRECDLMARIPDQQRAIEADHVAIEGAIEGTAA